MAKLIHENGPFQVYRRGHVLIILRDGEFCCNLRKADRGFRDPAHWVAEVLRVEREQEEQRIRFKVARAERVGAYLAKRAERVARAPEFAF